MIGLPLYAFTGQYKGLTRYVGSAALYRVAYAMDLRAFARVSRLDIGASDASQQQLASVVVVVDRIYRGRSFCPTGPLLNLSSTQHKKQLRVAIYGAGEAGNQLAAALRLAGNHRIVTFLDDNPAYWGRSINGVAIQPPRC